MTCQTLQGAVICSGPRGVNRRRIRCCWNCQTRRRVVEYYGGAYYGSRFTCVHCGDGWGDGERDERPFMRGWRQKAIKEARQDWLAALTPDEFRAAVDADLRPYLRPIEDVVSDL